MVYIPYMDGMGHEKPLPKNSVTDFLYPKNPQEPDHLEGFFQPVWRTGV